MGCNCKNKNFLVSNSETPKSNLTNMELLIDFSVKVISFLIGSLLLSIAMIPFSIYLLFKVIFLDGKLDVTKTMVNIGKLLKINQNEGDSDETYVNVNNVDDYVLDEIDEIDS